MESKVKFVTIGYIEWRKGQDILVKAIDNLPKDVLTEMEFILVGQSGSVLARELSKKIENISNIKMTGTLTREEVHRLIEEADVMICPSREDPMPTVCAEAMMHSVPCLVSDATGTAEYIKDGFNGFIFKNEDFFELSEKILWCAEHRIELLKMGKRAYEIYREVFSQDVFEKNMIQYVESMIGKA